MWLRAASWDVGFWRILCWKCDMGRRVIRFTKILKTRVSSACSLSFVLEPSACEQLTACKNRQTEMQVSLGLKIVSKYRQMTSSHGSSWKLAFLARKGPVKVHGPFSRLRAPPPLLVSHCFSLKRLSLRSPFLIGFCGYGDVSPNLQPPNPMLPSIRNPEAGPPNAEPSWKRPTSSRPQRLGRR